jgi:hypothetical protein
MTLAPLQLPLDSLPDEVGSLFPIVQDGIHAGQRPGWEPRRHLFVVDLFPAHLLISLIDPILDISYIGDIRFEGKPMTTPTEAGMKLLRRYLDAERNRHLVDAVQADGLPCKAMIFGHGQGAEKAAAMKLQRQGFALVSWKRGASHLLVVTDAGRRAAQ